MYRKIKFIANSSDKVYSDASGPNEWSPARYKRVAVLRQLALDYAREQGVDYLMVFILFFFSKSVKQMINQLCKFSFIKIPG